MPAPRAMAAMSTRPAVCVGGPPIERQDAEIEQHAAVGIERHDAPVRQADGEAESLRRHAAELLLKQAGRTHVWGGVIPFIDAGPERENDELVSKTAAERLHALEPLHRTTSPASTTPA